jgi:hypothetical protein
MKFDLNLAVFCFLVDLRRHYFKQRRNTPKQSSCLGVKSTEKSHYHGLPNFVLILLNESKFNEVDHLQAGKKV